MANLMHPFDSAMSDKDNARRCAERIALMQSIADRVDGEGMDLVRISGDEPGIMGMLFPTFVISFRGTEIFNLRGEAELVNTVMDLAAEVSDIFVQFQARHEATHALVMHVLKARKVQTAEWLEQAARLVNFCMETHSVSGNTGGEVVRVGDRLVLKPAEVVAIKT